MVRDVNAAADAGDIHKDDVPALLKALERFEEIFAVLKDDDAAKMRATVEWAKAEGLEDTISPATANWRRRQRCRMRRSRSWSRSTRRPARHETSRGRMRSEHSWPRTASSWRTPKTACGGKGSDQWLVAASG